MKYKKASFLERLIAFVIDIFVVVFLLETSSLLFDINYADLSFWLILVMYNSLLLWRSSTTLGKKLLKLKVVGISYQNINFGRSLLRESVGKLVSDIFSLGYLWMLIDGEEQTWHDKIAKTFVVKLDKSGNLIPIEAEEVARKKSTFVLLFLFSGLPIAISTLLIIGYQYILQPHKIFGEAMVPNYFSGQYYLTDKISYRISKPKRGDVIVFNSPKDPRFELFKRIVGLPGEEIEIKEGMIFINREVLKEPYLITGTRTRGGSYIQENRRFIVPDTHYFVLGDNRDFSQDSREFGFISKDSIVGKLSICYWNCSP